MNCWRNRMQKKQPKLKTRPNPMGTEGASIYAASCIPHRGGINLLSPMRGADLRGRYDGCPKHAWDAHGCNSYHTAVL